jgi:hypothetical protein
MKDPAVARVFEEFMRHVMASPPEIMETARVALEKQQAARALQLVAAKFVALHEVLNRPAGTMEAEDRLRQCNARMDELTDALLETPEPFRTQQLKELLPIREQVRAQWVKED